MGAVLLKAIVHVVAALNKDVTTGVWGLFAQMFLSPAVVFKDEDVLMVQVFMTTIALGMLPLLIIIQTMRLSAARALGMNSTPPEVLVHRAIMAGMACTSVSTIVWVIITFGDKVGQAFASAGLDLSVLKVLLLPLDSSPGLGLLLVGLFMIAGVILLTIQKAIISAELAVMLAFGPLSGLSLLNDQHGFFNTWLRETASLILTPLAQLIISWLFFRKLITFGDLSMSWEARLLTFGYFWVIWKCPSWLRQFAYSAGHGDLLVQGGASVTRMVVMRKMMSAAAKTVTPK